MSLPSIEFVSGPNGVLLADGAPFHVKGLSWFGAEGAKSLNHAPYGLHVHSLDWYFEFFQAHGFNVVRLFFCHQAVLENRIIPAAIHGLGKTDLHQLRHAPELVGLSYVAMLAAVSRAAAARGVLVLLANHRLTPSSNPGGKDSGLWYNRAVPIDAVKHSWSRLAQTMCASEWNVFAADVQNEPYKALWGSGDARRDWDVGAQELGDHILSVCERWLVFVQGIGDEKGAPRTVPSEWHFWGENLEGARSHPVRLRDPRRLVYSPHVYGPDKDPMAYFESNAFPRNLAEIWERHFGFVTSVGIDEFELPREGLRAREPSWRPFCRPRPSTTSRLRPVS